MNDINNYYPSTNVENYTSKIYKHFHNEMNQNRNSESRDIIYNDVILHYYGCRNEIVYRM